MNRTTQRRQLTKLAAILALSLAAHSQTTSAPIGRPAAPSTKWPTQEGNYDIPNFHFKDGETIEKLHLHYITLGKPHRDADGHTDNAILLLHGTGGNAH